jgi:hypothetical protein
MRVAVSEIEAVEYRPGLEGIGRIGLDPSFDCT